MRYLALVVVAACWTRPPPRAAPPAPPDNTLRGDARIIEQKPGGGVLALDGDRRQARNRAEVVMAGHCAGDYEITHEGDEAVERGGQLATEWRVHYVCRRAP